MAGKRVKAVRGLGKLNLQLQGLPAKRRKAQRAKVPKDKAAHPWRVKGYLEMKGRR